MDEDRYRKALDLEAAGKREAAAAELRALINASDNPSGDGLAFAALADILRLQSRCLEARGFISWAYSVLDKQSSAYPYVIFIDALVDEDLGKRKSAISKLDTIAAKYSPVLERPEHEALRNSVLLKKAINLALLQKNAEARPLLETALMMELDLPKTLFYLGTCCFKLREYEAAERYLKQVIELDLDPARAAKAHYTLSIVCYQRGRYAWARQELEWCLEFGGDYLPREAVLKAIMASSRALGLDEDLRRFSRLLRHP